MANVITGLRIICALVLLFCPTFSKLFYIVYLIGGLSDILDGIVARYFGKETEFGAKFDTFADIIFTVVVIIKVLRNIYVTTWLIIWIICIAIIKVINIISGFVICRHFISEHTALNKICGFLLFVIPLLINIFSKHLIDIFVALTCVIATISAIQEGHFIRTKKEIN